MSTSRVGAGVALEHLEVDAEFLKALSQAESGDAAADDQNGCHFFVWLALDERLRYWGGVLGERKLL
jgi:hypothetical protein